MGFEVVKMGFGDVKPGLSGSGASTEPCGALLSSAWLKQSHRQAGLLSWPRATPVATCQTSGGLLGAAQAPGDGFGMLTAAPGWSLGTTDPSARAAWSLLMGCGWFLLSSWEKLLLMEVSPPWRQQQHLALLKAHPVKLLGQLPARSLMLCHHLPSYLMLREAELLLSLPLHHLWSDHILSSPAREMWVRHGVVAAGLSCRDLGVYVTLVRVGAGLGPPRLCLGQGHQRGCVSTLLNHHKAQYNSPDLSPV